MLTPAEFSDGEALRRLTTLLSVGIVPACVSEFGELRQDGKSVQRARRQAASSGQSLLLVFYGGLGVGVVGLGAGAHVLLSSEDIKATAVRVGPGGVSVKGMFLCAPWRE